MSNKLWDELYLAAGNESDLVAEQVMYGADYVSGGALARSGHHHHTVTLADGYSTATLSMDDLISRKVDEKLRAIAAQLKMNGDIIQAQVGEAILDHLNVEAVKKKLEQGI